MKGLFHVITIILQSALPSIHALFETYSAFPVWSSRYEITSAPRDTNARVPAYKGANNNMRGQIASRGSPPNYNSATNDP